jgi:hypothetical protein
MAFLKIVDGSWIYNFPFDHMLHFYNFPARRRTGRGPCPARAAPSGSRCPRVAYKGPAPSWTRRTPPCCAELPALTTPCRRAIEAAAVELPFPLAVAAN